MGQRVRFAVGLDESENALRHTPKGGRVVRADALRLPFADDSFDVVLESNVLHHVDQPEEILREMARVGRESVVVIEPNRWHIPMAAFMLLVRAENRGLRFTRRHVTHLAATADLDVVALSVQGFVYETRTPAFVVPWLARFNRPGRFGAYVVAVLRKRAADR